MFTVNAGYLYQVYWDSVSYTAQADRQDSRQRVAWEENHYARHTHNVWMLQQLFPVLLRFKLVYDHRNWRWVGRYTHQDTHLERTGPTLDEVLTTMATWLETLEIQGEATILTQ